MRKVRGTCKAVLLGERGNKPYDLGLMLRIHALQNIYELSDEELGMRSSTAVLFLTGFPAGVRAARSFDRQARRTKARLSGKSVVVARRCPCDFSGGGKQGVDRFRFLHSYLHVCKKFRIGMWGIFCMAFFLYVCMRVKSAGVVKTTVSNL